MGENVGTPDFVVELVEAEVRLRLRLDVKLPLQRPDLFGCCQAPLRGGAKRLGPIASSSTASKAHQKSGSFAPPALPGLQRSYDPVRLPLGSSGNPDVEGTGLQPNGSPPITRVTLPTCRAHYPGGSRRVQVSVASPSHAAFPVIQAGRHPRLHFRGLLRLHSRYGPPDCSTAQGGLCCKASIRRLPGQIACQLPDQPTTLWVEPTATGDPRLRGAPNKTG